MIIPPDVGPSRRPIHLGPRDGGRFTPISRPEPYTRLLDGLRMVARASVRRVYNEPRVTRHVERLVLGWLLDMDPKDLGRASGRIGLLAANEARKILAMDGPTRTAHMARSLDAVQLWKRPKRPQPVEEGVEGEEEKDGEEEASQEASGIGGDGRIGKGE